MQTRQLDRIVKDQNDNLTNMLEMAHLRDRKLRNGKPMLIQVDREM